MPGAVISVARRPDGFIQCLYANNMSLQLLGMGLREITGPAFDFRKVIAEAQLPEFEQSLERCAATWEPFDMEFQAENAASGRRWVRCLATGSRGADGTVVFYLRLLDIEDRRRINEERERLKALLDMVVDNIPFMVYVKDARDATFVLANRAFEDMTGLCRSDVLGQKDLRSVFEWDWENRKAQFEQVLERGCPVDFPESMADTPKRGRRLLKCSKYPLSDETGKINYVLTITQDITERRNAENALLHSEQRLRDAIESLADGLALFDSDENLVMCNARYRAMWPGLSDDTNPGASFESLVRRYLETAKKHDSTMDVDTQVQTTLDLHRLSQPTRDVQIYDGRWIQVSNHPTAEGGFAITSTDVTALKEREESLRKASRQALHAKETAEGANRSKSDFLANMSHELRTPLNAVIGFSEIIKEALLGDHSIDPYRGYAQDIHDSGCHLLALINDILDMSKIEAGKLELFEENVDLTEAIDASLRLVVERAHQNKVSLSTDIPDDIPQLKCDLRKFKQITINILSNAVKFTPEGGSVTTRLFIGDGGGLYLRITDTGIGISKEDLEKVLEPFGQAEGGFDRQFEGTGLGLTLTQSLTELHGGRLEIESETEGPNRGTTVTAIFPASRVVT
jgi:PAS domain S-box-containing protein